MLLQGGPNISLRLRYDNSLRRYVVASCLSLPHLPYFTSSTTVSLLRAVNMLATRFLPQVQVLDAVHV